MMCKFLVHISTSESQCPMLSQSWASVCQPCCSDCFGSLMGTCRDSLEIANISFLEIKKNSLNCVCKQLFKLWISFSIMNTVLRCMLCKSFNPNQKILYRKPGLQTKCILTLFCGRHLLVFYRYKLNWDGQTGREEKFLTRTARHWNRLPREATQSPSSGVFKTSLAEALISWLTALGSGLDSWDLLVLCTWIIPRSFLFFIDEKEQEMWMSVIPRIR